MKNVLLGALLVLPSITFAQSNQTVIESRQHAFIEIEKQTNQLNEQLNNQSINWNEIETTSLALTQESKILALSFPKGSGEGSKAKESIWNNPEKFNQLMMRMDRGFTQLYQATEQQNMTEIRDGLEKALGTCKACHRGYRSRF
ncbi:c-type cytochrome [Aliivibrio salmonicida]|uniref:c-type cytochrome n=1 Tax=Aliivibrio salmonicida TaxID=40269 RepID=UPI003D0E6A1A